MRTLATLLSFENATSSALTFTGGLAGFTQIGGSKKTVAHYYHGGWRQRKPTEWSGFAHSENGCLVIHHKRTGHSFAAVVDAPGYKVELVDFGKEGKHFRTEISPIHLGPKERKEFPAYFFLTKGEKQPKLYARTRTLSGDLLV